MLLEIRDLDIRYGRTEAVTDPNVPPLPPHISWEQAKSFASSILRGDANALGFIKQTIKETVAAFTPSGDAKPS